MGSSRVDPLFLSYPLFFGECLLPCDNWEVLCSVVSVQCGDEHARGSAAHPQH